MGWASVTIESGGGLDSFAGDVELLGLREDLVGVVVGDQVDLVGISGWELKPGDISGTLGGWDVGEEERVERWVGGHVGEVDVNS